MRATLECGGGAVWLACRRWAWLLGVVLWGCGGIAEREVEDAPGAGGVAVVGGDSSDGGTGAGGGDACVERQPCRYADDCCSGRCIYATDRTQEDPLGICHNDCKGVGEPCNDSQQCCSVSCRPIDDHPEQKEGRCGRVPDHRWSCISDAECSTGYCYLKRSTCLRAVCDPRQNPEVDPERCWAVSQDFRPDYP